MYRRIGTIGCLTPSLQWHYGACKCLPVAAHLVQQCMGPSETAGGPETNIPVIMWKKPGISLPCGTGFMVSRQGGMVL